MLHDIWFQHNTVALIGSCNSTLSSMTHFSVREGLGGGDEQREEYQREEYLTLTTEVPPAQ